MNENVNTNIKQVLFENYQRYINNIMDSKARQFFNTFILTTFLGISRNKPSTTCFEINITLKNSYWSYITSSNSEFSSYNLSENTSGKISYNFEKDVLLQAVKIAKEFNVKSSYTPPEENSNTTNEYCFKFKVNLINDENYEPCIYQNNKDTKDIKNILMQNYKRYIDTINDSNARQFLNTFVLKNFLVISEHMPTTTEFEITLKKCGCRFSYLLPFENNANYDDFNPEVLKRAVEIAKEFKIMAELILPEEDDEDYPAPYAYRFYVNIMETDESANVVPFMEEI